MDTKSLRMRGLNRVRENWGLSMGAAVMAVILAGLGSNFIPDVNFTWSSELTKPFFTWMEGLNHDIALSTSTKLTVSPGSALNLVHFIIGGVIEMGYCTFLLKQHDGGAYQFNDLFSMFDRFGTGFAQRFLRNLYISLWSLLLVIPGIVAALSYAMTPYILAENPDMTASEAISRSKEMMDGHKSDLFLLRLTFLGWDLLAALTLNIGYLWLNPYKHAAEAAFYRQIQAPACLPEF